MDVAGVRLVGGEAAQNLAKVWSGTTATQRAKLNSLDSPSQGSLKHARYRNRVLVDRDRIALMQSDADDGAFDHRRGYEGEERDGRSNESNGQHCG